MYKNPCDISLIYCLLKKLLISIIFWKKNLRFFVDNIQKISYNIIAELCYPVFETFSVLKPCHEGMKYNRGDVYAEENGN